jgi:uncharacterized membrane protein YgcG
MKISASFIRVLIVITSLILATTQWACAEEDGKALMKKEELAQLMAPIALYPDSLLSQILMASTYPLEIVQADRWVQQNKSLKGDALAKALEAQTWDPSVKSLVNFPTVLVAMSQKLDLTTKLGDAFISQQKDVLDTAQELRKKAQAAGNLKTTKEQQVVVEKETIIIQPTNPQVVYVPTYSPAVVYGVWYYPAYPPYYYYPPPPAYYPAYHFTAGVAVGVAWGYAWGHCNWHGGNVNININQNTHINANINRNNYTKNIQNNGNGSWQHDASHRKGVAYRDTATAQKFNRTSTNDAAKAREAFRGRAEQGLSPGKTDTLGSGKDAARNAADKRSGSNITGQTAKDKPGSAKTSPKASSFEGMDRGGSTARNNSSRGNASFQGMSAGGGAKTGSFSGGGGRAVGRGR